jgi:hypothetical protein
VVSPSFHHDLCFLEGVEDFAVERFVAQLAIEAFAIAVLPGTARLDVERLGVQAGLIAHYDASTLPALLLWGV